MGKSQVLMKQFELGISSLIELNNLTTALGKLQNEFASGVIKQATKKLGILQEKAQDEKNTTNSAMKEIARMILDDAESCEQEFKAMMEQVVWHINRVVESKEKIKNDLVAEQEKKKKIIENAKVQVEKRRKDCLKQYRILQEMMKKVADGKAEINTEKDSVKKDKLIANVNKIEGGIFKHKTVVRNTFLQFEKLVEQVNEQIKRFHSVDCLNFVRNMQKLEKEKDAEIKTIYGDFIAQNKIVMQARVARRERVYENIQAISEEDDSNLFLQASYPLGCESPPTPLPFDLPVASSNVEDEANTLLKSGVLLRPSNPSKKNNELSETGTFSSTFLGKALGRISRNSNVNQISSPSPVLDTKPSAPSYKREALSIEAKQENDSSSSPPNISSTPKRQVFEPKPPPRKISDPARLSPAIKGHSGVRCMALYDYYENSDNPAEFLSFSAGEIIYLTSEDDPIWWTGYLNSDPTHTEKWFPAGYVEYK